MKKLIVALLSVLILINPIIINAEHYTDDTAREMIDSLMIQGNVLRALYSKNGAPKKEEYKEINYNDIIRERGEMVATKHTFEAEVLTYDEAIKDDEFLYAWGLVARGRKDYDWYYLHFYNMPDKKLMELDKIKVYGTIVGLYTMSFEDGEEISAPIVIVDKVLISGIDYNRK